MKRFARIEMALIVAGISVSVMGQTPELRHVFDITATIDGAFDLGTTPKGKRIVIPITGGSVTGKVTGEILPGGADYQIVNRSGDRTELRAVYTIMTSDSTLINVTNEGIISTREGGYYFMTSPRFECDENSDLSWLNDKIFVCRPIDFPSGAIVLRVWEVE